MLPELRYLSELLKELDMAETEERLARRALDPSFLQSKHLENYDKNHLEEYIKEKIGEKPIEPDGPIKLLLPVYLIQKAQYDAAIANYIKMRPLAEASYREEFHKKRDELRIMDNEEEEQRLTEGKKRLEVAEERLVCAKEKVSSNTTVSGSLKQKQIIDCLISYLEEGRADNLKEAVNLFYDEKRKDEEAKKAEAHRQEMLALEEEKVRAAQAAEKYQRLQYEAAQDAAYYAQQAAEEAREAADTVESMQYDRLYED